VSSPIAISSPSARRRPPSGTGSRFTKLPFVEPSSRIHTLSPSALMLACTRERPRSPMHISAESPLPSVKRSPRSGTSVTSSGEGTEECRHVPRSDLRRLLRIVELCVRVHEAGFLCNLSRDFPESYRVARTLVVSAKLALGDRHDEADDQIDAAVIEGLAHIAP